MNLFFKRLEHVVDKSIVPALLLLFVIIIIEFFFVDISHDYHLIISIFHYLIILT